MNVLRFLRLDADRWRGVDERSVWAAGAIVVVACSLLALSRFGGLTFDAPRSWIRLVLVGVWGWLGMSFAIWAVARLVTRHPDAPGPAIVLAVVGLAHVPLVALAGVVFVAAVMLEVLGPGMVVAIVVLGAWFPASVVAGLRWTLGLRLALAAAVGLAAYAVWYVVVGDHYVEQIQHLL